MFSPDLTSHSVGRFVAPDTMFRAGVLPNIAGGSFAAAAETMAAEAARARRD